MEYLQFIFYQGYLIFKFVLGIIKIDDDERLQ